MGFAQRSPVAQLVEQVTVNHLVAGSSPARGANSLRRRFNTPAASRTAPQLAALTSPARGANSLRRRFNTPAASRTAPQLAALTSPARGANSLRCRSRHGRVGGATRLPAAGDTGAPRGRRRLPDHPTPVRRLAAGAGLAQSQTDRRRSATSSLTSRRLGARHRHRARLVAAVRRLREAFKHLYKITRKRVGIARPSR